MDEQTARREIVRVGQLMYERGYVVSSDGNVSVRLEDGRIVATPTMTSKGRMTEEGLAIVDAEGRALNKARPSSELAMHLLIYRGSDSRSGVRAACRLRHAFDQRAYRGDAAAGQVPQCAADGESWCGGLWRRALAIVRPFGDA